MLLFVVPRSVHIFSLQLRFVERIYIFAFMTIFIFIQVYCINSLAHCAIEISTLNYLK